MMNKLQRLIFGLSLCISAAIMPHTAPDYQVIAIDNASAESVAVTVPTQETFSVAPATCLPKKWLTIPFITFKQYRDEFIGNKPLFPQEALHIKTLHGTYAIWANEIGIMRSRKRIDADSYEDGRPFTLLKNPTKEEKLRLLLLSIDHVGEVTVKQP